MIKRIWASVLDIFIYLLFFFLVNPYIIQFLDFIIGHKYLRTADYVSILSVLIYFILFEVIFYTSPGKWLFNLRITTHNNEHPKRKILFFRAILKLLTLVSVFGAIVNFVFLLSNKYSWYDNILGLSVEVYKQDKLTNTQEEWRKYFK